MKNGDKPIASPFVRLREEFDDWAILFDCDTGHGFGLSPTGVYLWKLIDGEHSIDDLLKEITHLAEGVPEEASDHIKAFVDALVAEGLAGFDRSKFGLPDDMDRAEKRSSPPPAPLSEMKPFTYEPPKLVDFTGAQVAHGSCNNGSSPSGSCGSGHFACGCSTGTSTTERTCCYSGGCPSYTDACCNGNCQGNGTNCCGGTCDCSGSAGCWDGCNATMCYSGCGAYYT